MKKVIICVFGWFLLLGPSPGLAADEQPFPVGQMVRQEQVLLPRDHRGEQSSNQGQDCRPGTGPGYGRPCVRDHRTDPDPVPEPGSGGPKESVIQPTSVANMPAAPTGYGGETGQTATELSIRECVSLGGSVESADVALCKRGYTCVTYDYYHDKFLHTCIDEASADGLD